MNPHSYEDAAERALRNLVGRHLEQLRLALRPLAVGKDNPLGMMPQPVDAAMGNLEGQIVQEFLPAARRRDAAEAQIAAALAQHKAGALPALTTGDSDA
jgi:hypothetical protein